jgi:hypothetical protein
MPAAPAAGMANANNANAASVLFNVVMVSFSLERLVEERKRPLECIADSRRARHFTVWSPRRLWFRDQGAGAGPMQSNRPTTASVRANTNAMPPATILRHAGWAGVLSFAAARDFEGTRSPLTACIRAPSGYLRFSGGT